MSAATPPHQPRRAHAFINHSPDSYKNAIALRLAKQNAQQQPQQQTADAKLNASSDVKQEVGNVNSASRESTQSGDADKSSEGAAGTVNSNNKEGAGISSESQGGDQRNDHSSDGESSDMSNHSSPPQDASTPTRSDANSSFSSQDTSMDQSSQILSQGSQSGSSQPPVREIKDVPRKRRRTSPNELHILETAFARNDRPCKSERERIASLTSMDEKAVQVWFQNKRQSCRRQKSQVSATASRTQSLPVIMHQDENSLMACGLASTFAMGPAIGRVSTPMAPPMLNHTPPPSLAQQHANNLNILGNQFSQRQMLSYDKSAPLTDKNAAAAAPAARRSKSLKLSMSADGKAELVERSPLKQLHQNTLATSMQVPPLPQFMPAARFATMPMLQPPSQLSGKETECVNSLLVLKSGQWH